MFVHIFCKTISYIKFEKILKMMEGLFMIIKTEEFELEISVGTDVYFGSRASGQIFKKWDDLEDDDQLKLKSILRRVHHLIRESEGLLLEKQPSYAEVPGVSQPASMVSYLAG